MFPGSPFKSSSACNQIYFAISQTDFAKSVHRQTVSVVHQCETPGSQNRHRVSSRLLPAQIRTTDPSLRSTKPSTPEQSTANTPQWANLLSGNSVTPEFLLYLRE